MALGGPGLRLAAVFLTAACAAPAPAPTSGEGAPWRDLLDPRLRPAWEPIPYGGEGRVRFLPEGLILEPGSPLTGLRWKEEGLPEPPYEMEVVAARLQGTDFFCGLTFPAGGGRALTLVLGGWGGSLCGLSNLDHLDASANETTRFLSFEEGRDYRLRLQVLPDRIRAELEGRELFEAVTAGRHLSLRPEVEASRPLGISAYATRARIRRIAWRPLAPGT